MWHLADVLAVGPTPQKRATSSCQDHRPSSCMSPRHLFGSSHFVGHQAQFLGIVGFFSFPILTYLMDTERRCLVFDPVPAVAPQDTTHIFHLHSGHRSPFLPTPRGSVAPRNSHVDPFAHSVLVPPKSRRKILV